jgi:tetratricopeptide (TPR) repeat protein
VRHLDPENLRARFALGQLGVLRGQWQAALELLIPCAEDIHARKQAHRLLAQVYTRLGQTDRARAEQQQADQAPEDTRWPDPLIEDALHSQRGLRFRLSQADSLFDQQRYEEAIRLLEETVQRYANSTEARLQLGDCLQQLQRLGEAEQVFQQATAVDPDSPDAWFRLGCLQAARNRSQEAAVSFRRAIRLKPDYTLAHFNLGHRLLLLGDRAGAADAFRAALRSRPDYAPARDALRALEDKGGNAVPVPKP